MTIRVDDALHLAAGQLYMCQAPKVPVPSKFVEQIVRGNFESKKVQVTPSALSFVDYTNDAVDSFNAILDRIQDEESTNRLTDFWNKTVEEATDEQKQVAAKTVLSQLLFLADEECEELKSILTSEAPSNALATHFQKRFAEIFKEASDKVVQIQTVKLAEKASVEANLLARCAAYTLVTSTGFLNSGLIPDVIKALGNKQPFIAKMLDVFMQNPALLDSVEEPEEDETPALLSGMRFGAKEAVLSACLTPNSTKSLVATTSSLLREVDMSRFITQLNAILKDGSFSKTFEGLPNTVVVECDYTKNPLLNHTFKAATTGEVEDNNWYNNNCLWNVQGMVNACTELGLKKVMEDECKKALTILGGEKPARRFSVTVLDIIKTLAGENQDDVKAASYAFLSAYSNPLLDAWHQMTETLTQVRAENRHFARVHSAVSNVLASQFTDDKVFATFKEKLETALVTKAKDVQEFRSKVASALPEGSEKIVEFIGKKQFLSAVGSWDKVEGPVVDDVVRLFDDTSKKAFTVASPKELATAIEAAVKEEKEGMRLMLSSSKGPLEYVAFKAPHWSTVSREVNGKLKDEAERTALISWIRENHLVEGVRDLFDESVATMGKKWDNKKFREELQNRLSHLVEVEKLASVKEAIDTYILDSTKDRFVAFGKTASNETVGLFWDPYATAVAVGMISKDHLVRLPDSWVNGKWEFCHAPVA